METDVLEKEEISLDFLPELEKENEGTAEKTLVIIMKAESEVADIRLCGKSMLDWLVLATSVCPHKVIDEVDEEGLLQTIRPLCEGYETIVVLFSDTPLLEKSTFAEILQRFGGRNVMKLPRGWVFKGDFVRGAYMLLSTAVEDFGREDFKVVNTPAALSFAFKVLQRRIISYHMQNGVIFFGDVLVDADVEIEAGAVIYQNNVLKGQTYIGKGVVLESGNYIENSIICDWAKLVQSHLENSKVEAGKSVPPFTKLIGQVF